MSLPFAAEKQFALAAVRRASIVTTAVFNKLVKNETLTKGDKSPVTVGDYAAQAVIGSMLRYAYPSDPIVGEEDAAELRLEPGHTMRDRIVELANEALTSELGLGDNVEWGIGPGQAKSTEELLDAIDRGNYSGGPTGRMWCIDPIDGTKGFLRGEQYAICLALIVDAKVQVGIIGCPNLGAIFAAVRGQSAEQVSLTGGNPTPLSMPYTPTADLVFLESAEPAHSSQDTAGRIAKALGVTKEPIRMDSQAKYGCLARGDGGVYMRMPTGVGYKEKIWDHAPGSLLVEEAGGAVCDSRGLPLDFGLGRTLGENYGVIAAHKKTLPLIVQAVASAAAKA